ncbi:MAG: leucine-rich repeat domain-containing protein [Eubacteriales bacterium]
MKRVLSVFLALAIIFLMIPMGAVRASAEQSGDYFYDFSGTDTVMITGYSGAGGDIVIPDKLDGYTVDEITDGAFSNCTALISVVIPDSVTVIGFNSFAQCSGLTSFTISDSVTVIETAAFFQCTGLKTVKIGCNVKTIGNTAFAYCTSLTGVVLPNSVTEIETSAFSHCEAMTNVSIPDSVTDIGVSVFEHCSSLTGVVMPADLTVISNGLFDGCSKLASIVIPEGVTTIGDSAFKRCEALTGVIIPNSVTVIGSQAFEGCIGLTAIAIPNSVTNIGDSAFSNCTGLADIILSNGLTIIKDSTFERCLALTEVIIPSSVTDIKDLAFNYCSALSKAYFLGNAPILNSMVFDGCAEEFKVYYINGNSTFSNPWQDYETTAFFPLTTPSFSAAPVLPTNGNVSVEITFPGDAVTKEFKLGLDDWTAYTTPVTLTENGTVYARCKDAGVNTSDIGSIIVSNVDKVAPAAPVLEAMPLSPTENDVTVTITYPVDAAVKEYKLAGGGWLAYNDPVVLSANSTVFARCADSAGNISRESSISVYNIIHDGDFSYDIVGTSATVTDYNGAGGAVTIPDMLGGYPVTVIGHDSFMGCEELTSVIIPDSVTSIEADAFHLCSGLTEVFIPNNVTEIGDYAFKACTGLTSLIIGTGVTNIGTGAFSSCSLLTGVSIPDSVTTIGTSAFRYCVALTDLTFGSSVADIGWGAFQGCSQLAGAYFFGDAPQIDDEVFTFCAPAFTVYYIEGKTGFESPWHGYTTATFTPLATPVLSATPSSPTKGNVTITITYPESPVTKEYKLGTGVWTPYTGALVLTGNNSVFARCRDGVGILSRLGSITVSNIDKIPPDVPTFASSPSEPTWDKVTVIIIYPADAAVKQYKLRQGPWELYEEPLVLWENDVVKASCTDTVGNFSSIGTFEVTNIDRDPPADPVISADPTEPTNGDVIVTITYPPDAAVKEYRVMGGSGPEGWTPYTAPVNITAISAVFARCKDAAGNPSEESFLAVTNIDKQGPDTPV